MDKSLIFICSEQGFAVNGIIKTLEGEGLSVTKVSPVLSKIEQNENAGKSIVLYADGPECRDQKILSYLKERVRSSSGVKLYVVGSDMDFEQIFSVLDREDTAGIFRKPVNAKELCGAIKRGMTEETLYSILVVDDDSVMLRTLKNWLSGKYSVHMVNSGMNAISFLASNTVDLILLDYEMPVISGLQVFQMLKAEERTKDIPVIFLTAKDDKETVMKVLEAKPDRYLLKTLPPAEILQGIADFLKEKSES